MSDKQTPDGMIPVEEWAKQKGIASRNAIIRMIREGTYTGQVVEGQWYIRVDQQVVHNGGASAKTDIVATPPTFSLPTLLYILAALSLLGGLILGAQFWPEGWNPPPLAYVWAIIWIMAGIIEAVLFAAIGLALTYLSRIATNTEKS